MRRIAAAVLALCIAHSTSAAAAPAPPPVAPAAAAVREGWPATRAGELAWRWVSAFDSGEAAMREFNANWRAPDTDAAPSERKRTERYRDLRERFGTLTLHSVIKSSKDELTVRLLASDGTRHDFVFHA